MEEHRETDPLIQSRQYLSSQQDHENQSLNYDGYGYPTTTSASDSHESETEISYAQYNRRWYILAVVCAINVSNAMVCNPMFTVYTFCNYEV